MGEGAGGMEWQFASPGPPFPPVQWRGLCSSQVPALEPSTSLPRLLSLSDPEGGSLAPPGSAPCLALATES